MMRREAQHDTAATRKHEGVRAEVWREHQPRDRVLTVDGPGQVIAVNDGPYPGSEEYEIELEGGLGGGTYGPGQITAALPTQASVEHTAQDDYPELGNLLHERPDPATMQYTASLQATAVGSHEDYEDPNKVYLRFGSWPEDERSRNNITGHREDGVSVYDLDHEGEPEDPDPGLDRVHKHDEHCESYCDLDKDEFVSGRNDAAGEMRDRVGRAEETRRRGGSKYHPDVGHLVKGDMVSVGYDGEPLLNNVRRVGDWIDHRHLFIPGAQPHHLAREPHDEDYEPPEEHPTHHTARSINGEEIDQHGTAPDRVRAYDPNGYDAESTEGEPDPEWLEEADRRSQVMSHKVMPSNEDSEHLRQHLVDHHGYSHDQLANLGESGQGDEVRGTHEAEHELSGYDGVAGDGYGHGEVEDSFVEHSHDPNQVHYLPAEMDGLNYLLNPGRGGHSEMGTEDVHTKPIDLTRDLAGLPGRMSSLPSVEANYGMDDAGEDGGPRDKRNFDKDMPWNHPCAECGSGEHHTGQHDYGDHSPEDTHGYVGDGLFCKNCGESGKLHEEKEAVSFRELRQKLPHGADCDHCGKEIIPPRPHIEAECEDPEGCHAAGEEHISPHDPRNGTWGDESDRKTLEMADADWKHTLHQRDQDEQSAGSQIDDLFSGPEFKQHKDFMEGNGRGPTHLSSLLITAAMDPEFRFQVTASWRDVQNKAKRIRSEGGVEITHATDAMVIGNVKGDHNVYESGLQRMPGKRTSVAHYSCGCKWGAYHWGASDDFSRFAGRMCSHALALQYEAQSRGMFGRDVSVDDTKPRWVPPKVVVKYDIDSGQHMRAESSLPEIESERTFPEHAPLMVVMALADDTDPAMPFLAAVNDMFGDNSGRSEPSLMDPMGATEPWDKNQNPTSAGPLRAAEPDNWGSITNPSMFPSMASLIRTEAFWDKVAEAAGQSDEGAEATLHDEPEGALPETDGSEHTAASDQLGLFDDPPHQEVKPREPIWYHGTRHEIQPGEHILPGRQSNQGYGQPAEHVYFSSRPEIAAAFAEAGQGPEHDPDARPRVYRVKTTGPWEPDEHEEWTTGAHQSKHPIQVEAEEPWSPRWTKFIHNGSLGDVDIVNDTEVGDLADDALSPENLSIQTQGSVEDVVAAFQQSAGAKAIMNSAPKGRANDGMDLAAAAEAHLAKVASFSAAERQELINEAPGTQASNTDRLDIAGTHYADLEDMDTGADDDSWLM